MQCFTHPDGMHILMQFKKKTYYAMSKTPLGFQRGRVISRFGYLPKDAMNSKTSLVLPQAENDIITVFGWSIPLKHII